jgi:uncharacterized protein YdaU (DUF1376 family)
MPKVPSVEFYPDNYDGGVKFMTYEEKGRYMDLLMLQAHAYADGHHIPAYTFNDVCGGSERVKAKFKVDENGDFYQERMELELNKKASRSRAGSAGMASRWGVDNKSHNKTDNKDDNKKITKVITPCLCLCKDVKDVSLSSDFDFKDVDVDVKGGSGGEPEKGAIFGDMPPLEETWSYDEARRGLNYNLDNAEWIGRKALIDGFDRFWLVYPVKKGKDKAWRVWRAIVEKDKVDPEAIIRGLLTAKAKSFREVAFTPHPATWLSDGRWKDEYTENETKGGLDGSDRGNTKSDVYTRRYGGGLL